MKRRNLEELLQRHGKAVFAAYMLLSGVPLFIYKTEFHEPFNVAFSLLGPPILLCSFFVYLYKMPAFRAKVGMLKGSLSTLLYASVMLFMSTGLVTLANALGPGQHKSVLDGQVVDLSVSHVRSSTHYLVTVRTASGKDTQFEVSGEEYAQLSLGQHYSQTWTVGSLGILYK